MDHKDVKDTISSIRIQKRVGKIYEVYFEEKNTFTPSLEDQARGFSLFKKSSGEDLFPNSLPGKDDLVKEYKASGVRGEFEPIVICVLPIKDLNGVNISVSDLTKENGKTIVSANIAVKHVKYEYMIVQNSWMVKGRYMVKGAVDTPAGVTRAFWLTVKVPVDAEPGVYKGKANIMAGGLRIEAPVSFEVLPFDWAEFSPLHTYWMWDYNGYLENTQLEKRLENLRDHGMNCFDSGIPATWKIEGGEMKIDFSTADRVAPLLKKYGFKKWMFDNMIYGQIAKASGTRIWSEEHKKLYKSMLLQFKAKAEKDNWPELIWTVDEPRESEDDGSRGIRTYADMMEYAKLLAEIGVHSNISWANQAHSGADYTDVVPFAYYNTTHAPVVSCEKIIIAANAKKKPLLLYNCGQNRYAFGVLVKQKNALGNSQFWYCAAKYGIPTMTMATWSCAVYDNNNDPVDTYDWDQIREGVDDYKYIWTLEQALEKCADKGSPEAAAAQQALEGIARMSFKTGSGDNYGAEFMAPAMVYYDGSLLDNMRANLVKCIIALQNK